MTLANDQAVPLGDRRGRLKVIRKGSMLIDSGLGLSDVLGLVELASPWMQCVRFSPFFPKFTIDFFQEKSRKIANGALKSLAHWESGTAIPSSGDSSQPSNEPFEGGHSTPFSRHFLNKKFLWTSFLDPNFLVLSLSPWGGRKLWPPFTATFETRCKLQSQQTRQLEREDERAEAQIIFRKIWYQFGGAVGW